MSKVEDLMQYLVEQLDELEISHTNPHWSETDYGTSGYLNIDDEALEGYPKYNPIFGIKVRISDHSVENIQRMKTEVHLHSESSIDFYLGKLEDYIYTDEEE